MSNPECNHKTNAEKEQWEYCTICDNPGYLMEPLRRLGLDGWEAFAVVSGGSCHTIYFKRKKK
jgi:hypothetical protein